MSADSTERFNRDADSMACGVSVVLPGVKA
jgi:hypothetical protein